MIFTFPVHFFSFGGSKSTFWDFKGKKGLHIFILSSKHEKSQNKNLALHLIVVHWVSTKVN